MLLFITTRRFVVFYNLLLYIYNEGFEIREAWLRLLAQKIYALIGVSLLEVVSWKPMLFFIFYIEKILAKIPFTRKTKKETQTVKSNNEVMS